MGCGVSSRIQPVLPHSSSEPEGLLSQQSSPSSPLVKQAATQTDIQEEEGDEASIVDSKEVTLPERSDKVARMIVVQPFRSSPQESEIRDLHSNNSLEEANLKNSSNSKEDPATFEPAQTAEAEGEQTSLVLTTVFLTEPHATEGGEVQSFVHVAPSKITDDTSSHPEVEVDVARIKAPVKESETVTQSVQPTCVSATSPLEIVKPFKQSITAPFEPPATEPVKPVKQEPAKPVKQEMKLVYQFATELVKINSMDHLNTDQAVPVKPLGDPQTGQDKPVSLLKPQDGDSASKSEPKLTPELRPENSHLQSKSTSNLSDVNKPMLPPKQKSANGLTRSSNTTSVAASLLPKRKSRTSLGSDVCSRDGVVLRCASSGKLTSATKLSLSRESLRAATQVYATDPHGKRTASWSKLCSRSQENLKLISNERKINRGKVESVNTKVKITNQ